MIQRNQRKSEKTKLSSITIPYVCVHTVRKISIWTPCYFASFPT